jgi:excisionase family DNA binding protein
MPRQKLQIPITERRTLTVDETAALLGISRASIYKLLDAGKIQSVLIAGRRLFPREAVDALIARHMAA